MSNNNQSAGGSAFAGFLLGALAGAAIALLYAPKPGKETRDELAQRLDDMKGRLDTAAKEMAELTREKYEEAKTDLGQAVDAGRAAAKARADELRHKVGLE